MPDLTRAFGLVGIDPHPEQVVMADAMRRDSDDGAITLLEAPPASGKTLAIAWHACDLPRRTGDRVLVAVPTLAIMRQMVASIRRLGHAAFPDVSIGTIHGRQEFVHPGRARSWLTAIRPDALETFEAWVAEQGDDGWTRSSLDEALRAVELDIDMPMETSILTSRGSEAEEPYRRQFTTDAGVVVCTHAFLARDVATRVGRLGVDAGEDLVEANERRLRLETQDDRILPEWRHLIVDEAHQLAAGFMMALTTRLSYRRLLKTLDACVAAGADVPAKQVEALRKAVGIAERRAPSEGLRRSRRLSMDDRYDAALVRHVTNCIPEDPSTLGVDERTADHMRRFRDAATLAQRNRRLVAPSIAWSDVQGALGLVVAPLAFGRQLDFCFRSCRSAALLSATLYSHDDEVAHDHLRRQLSLPEDRLRAHPALPARWSTDPVVLHLPDTDAAAHLDPRRRDWTSSLAEVVAMAADEAELGTLVLCTSHQTVAEVAELLGDDHAGRIMVTDDRGVGPTADRFVAAVTAGTRPIWIATGPAWTGLDLPDDTLDALVVARLPFGLANPIVQEHMSALVKTRVGYRDMETDMLKLLRQGIGRLVRSRDSERTRGLWIADGRISGQPAGARAAAMLEAYGTSHAYAMEP